MATSEQREEYAKKFNGLHYTYVQNPDGSYSSAPISQRREMIPKFVFDEKLKSTEESMRLMDGDITQVRKLLGACERHITMLSDRIIELEKRLSNYEKDVDEQFNEVWEELGR